MPACFRWLTLFVCALAVTSAWARVGVLDQIESSKTLRVCVWPDYFGISYRDPKTRGLVGIDIDLARALADELKVGLEFVDSSFASLIDDVSRNRCDIAMFAIGITPQRQKFLRFTKPHLASDIYAITRKGNRRIKGWDDIDTPGTVVAVAKGTLHEPVMREKLRYATLRVLDTPMAREQEVESGRADVFMTDYPFSQRMLKTADWARLVKPTSTYHVTPYAWAMRQDDDAWYAYVDQFIDRMRKQGVLRQSAIRHGLLPIALLD